MKVSGLTYQVGDNIIIGAIGVAGRISAIHISIYGIEYTVRYFDNCELRVETFTGDEITLEG